MSAKVKWSIGGGVIVGLIIVVVALQIAFPSNNSSGVKARFGVPSAQAAEPIGHIGTGKAAEALEKAGNSGRYVFALFFRDNNDQLATARTTIEAARKRISRKSEVVEINVTDQSEQDIVSKYGVSRAPMPLVLEIAPNGAIMVGQPVSQLNEDKLVEAVGTKGSEQVIKALQQKNMVVIAAQGSRTASNAAAMRGVEAFAKDPKYGPTTAVVTIDPSDPAEAKFLSKLNIDPTSPIATTTLLAPPGSVIGSFSGETDVTKLVASVQAAAAPKAGGCCGGGRTCGPSGGAAAAPQKAPMVSTPMTVQPQVQAQPMQVPAKTTPAPTTTKSATTTQTAQPTTKSGN